MRICSACGQEVLPGDDFCTSCGTRQAAIPPGRPEPEPDVSPVTSLDGPPAPPAWLTSRGSAGAPGSAEATEARADPWRPAADEEGAPTVTGQPSDQSPQVTAFEGPPTPPPPRPPAPPSAGLPAPPRPPDPGAVNAADGLLGEAAPNAVYLGQRMLYEKNTTTLENLDPVRNGPYLWAVFWHGLAVFLVYALGQIVIVIVSAILSYMNGRLGEVVGSLAAIAWWIVMACIFWLHKVSTKLSEWKFLVDGKAAVATATFDHIAWAFSRRETPVESCRARRFKVMGQGSREVLEVRQQLFCGLVSCFASGKDLYIGWTFWFSLSPARWLLSLIRRFFWFLRLHGSEIYLSLQFDTTRALREALHSAVREGVDVAAGQLPAQGHGTIGSLVPVVTDDSVNDPSWQWLVPSR